MKITKEIAGLQKFTSELKTAISGVLLKDNKVVATDGFRLVELETPTEDITGVYNMKRVKIPTKGDTYMSVHGEILNGKSAIESLPAYKVADSSEFPTYESIIPKEKPVAELHINGRYLAEVCAYLAKLDRSEAVDIAFHGATKPVVITVKGKARALVMPMMK